MNASGYEVLSRTPDADGNIYVVLPEDARYDVTPVIKTSTGPLGAPGGALSPSAPTDNRAVISPSKLKPSFYARAGMLAQGYDPMPTNKLADHWTSLAVGGTNEITELRLPLAWATNRIELKVTGPISVTPTSGFTNLVTPLTIVSTGTNGDVATIEAQAVDGTNRTTIVTLQVMILPLRLVPVGIFRVTDPASEATALGDTDSNETIINTLNQIFKQANVQFYDQTTNFADGEFVNGISINYDLDAKNGLLDRGPNSLVPDEEDIIKNWVQSNIGNSLLPILFIRQWSVPYNTANLPPPLKDIRRNTFGPENKQIPVIFAEPARLLQSLTGTHEVGHFLGLDHWPDDVVSLDFPWPMDNGVKVEHLMRPGAPKFWPTDPNADMSDTSNWMVPFPGQWMDKESWDQVNKKAKQKFP